MLRSAAAPDHRKPPAHGDPTTGVQFQPPPRPGADDAQPRAKASSETIPLRLFKG